MGDPAHLPFLLMYTQMLFSAQCTVAKCTIGFNELKVARKALTWQWLTKPSNRVSGLEFVYVNLALSNFKFCFIIFINSTLPFNGHITTLTVGSS